MATTTRSEQLTESHKASQLTIVGGLARELTRLWPLLDPLRLTETTPGWLEAVMRALLIRRHESARRAVRYFDEFKRAELGRRRSTGIELFDFVEPEPNLDQIRTSLLVTGPIRQRQLTAAGETPEQAARLALKPHLQAAQRHTLNGGREAIDSLIKSDEDAVGWVRITDGDACHFCAMMASRGAVYRSRATASGQWHDGCGCTVEPVFTRSAPLPETNQKFAQIWADSTEGLSGKDAVNAFRRALEADRK